jgi:hypothetical protein
MEAERFWLARWQVQPNNKGGTAEFTDNFVPGDECVSFFMFRTVVRSMWQQHFRIWRKNRQKGGFV